MATYTVLIRAPLAFLFVLVFSSFGEDGILRVFEPGATPRGSRLGVNSSRDNLKNLPFVHIRQMRGVLNGPGLPRDNEEIR